MKTMLNSGIDDMTDFSVLAGTFDLIRRDKNRSLAQEVTIKDYKIHPGRALVECRKILYKSRALFAFFHFLFT